MDIIRILDEIPQVSALVDSDATSSFINQTFVAQHNIPMVKKSAPVPVEVIDGRTITSGAITHEIAPLQFRIGKHVEKIVLNIMSSLVCFGYKRTTLSSISDPEPSPSVHNSAPLKNPKPKKKPCQVLPRTM